MLLQLCDKENVGSFCRCNSATKKMSDLLAAATCDKEKVDSFGRCNSVTKKSCSFHALVGVFTNEGGAWFQSSVKTFSCYKDLKMDGD